MSGNLIMSRKQIITLIKSAPKYKGGCTLMRLGDALGSNMSCLIRVANEAGLDESEAKGVMDGWDLAQSTASGKLLDDGITGFTFFNNAGHVPGYSYGMQLGAEIFFEIYGGAV